MFDIYCLCFAILCVFVLFFGEDHWGNSTTTRKFGPKFNSCIDVVYERVKLTRSEQSIGLFM